MMEPIILASSSPRRQEYFHLLGLPFSIMPARIDERLEVVVDPREMVEKIAVKKVNRILEILKNRSPPWICGVDTIVSVETEFFGKPQNREDAQRMLKLLQNRSHSVITAVALFNGRTRTVDCRSVMSVVSFAPLSEEEVEWYINTGEWQGAAGGYKIQGLASCFVTEIQGSYSSIVGLPLREFYVMLKDNGYLMDKP